MSDTRNFEDVSLKVAARPLTPSVVFCVLMRRDAGTKVERVGVLNLKGESQRRAGSVFLGVRTQVLSMLPCSAM